MTAGAYSLLAVVLYHTGDFNQVSDSNTFLLYCIIPLCHSLSSQQIKQKATINRLLDCKYTTVDLREVLANFVVISWFSVTLHGLKLEPKLRM